MSKHLRRAAPLAAFTLAVVALTLAVSAGFGAFRESARSSAQLVSGAVGGTVRVHGHWTIDVRSRSGKIVARRQFENSYVPSSALATVLAHQITVGTWQIQLESSDPAQRACLTTSNDVIDCFLIEPGGGTDIPGFWGPKTVFQTLTVTAPGQFEPDYQKLVLHGTMVAARDGVIDSVVTGFNMCTPATPASDPCGHGSPPYQGGVNFTSTNITPISVSTDQQVTVTVKVSFSS